MSINHYPAPDPASPAADDWLKPAERAARMLFGLEAPRLSRLEGGRVNESFRVESAGRLLVLQRLSDFFLDSQSLGLNWYKIHRTVTEKLPLKLAPVPPIYQDLQGRFVARSPQSEGSWRLTGFVDGGQAPKNPVGGREAARLLGRLHRALNYPAPLDLAPPPEGEFTNQHLPRPDEFTSLETAYRGHPGLTELQPLIDRAAEAAMQLPFFPGFRNVFNFSDVIIHGDCKAENFLFNREGRAICLLDWDSVGYGQLLVDIAEMLRSWGLSLKGNGTAAFENFSAVLQGYAETGLPLNEDDLNLLAPVLRAITLNLARRYLTDALAGIYFKWDRAAYPSLYDQNKARAQKMLDLADYLLDHEADLTEAFRRGHQAGLEFGQPQGPHLIMP